MLQLREVLTDEKIGSKHEKTRVRNVYQGIAHVRICSVLKLISCLITRMCTNAIVDRIAFGVECTAKGTAPAGLCTRIVASAGMASRVLERAQ